VGTRLTRDQIIDQVSNGTPGGGNMPAYGKQMKPDEMAAVTEFLVSLRPPDRPAALPASDIPPPTGERAER
jgi:ubiquinol-cytochrome c reductase cytochrome b subunit